MTDEHDVPGDREIAEQELEDVSGGLIPSSSSSEFPDVTKVPPAPSTTPTPIPNTTTEGEKPTLKK